MEGEVGGGCGREVGDEWRGMWEVGMGRRGGGEERRGEEVWSGGGGLTLREDGNEWMYRLPL